ncbi:zinc finger BED domain-containing protein RICESLEEPER 2 [Prunus yedoensis var. nudiflora]|uniref:Zinc finger BED domain-containing protein RICESLEEPER 2 n=1 Tax=Prunus yedoensis var. nudiflora TaxID=2094558 RepID=A0A314Z5Y9_PRUYE|nr:zinc finger BED domain-containing protein RICESLEEPER 2 [Prunus yedoensis var. nudiflora]
MGDNNEETQVPVTQIEEDNNLTPTENDSNPTVTENNNTEATSSTQDDVNRRKASSCNENEARRVTIQDEEVDNDEERRSLPLKQRTSLCFLIKAMNDEA